MTITFMCGMISLLLCFWTANWEEYHTGVLKCSNGTVGLTEGIYLICIGFFLHSYTDGQFGKTTMRDIGRILMPSVKLPEVQAALGQYLNGSKVMIGDRLPRLHQKITDVGNLRFMEFFILFAAPIEGLVILGNVQGCVAETKHSLAHALMTLACPVCSMLLFGAYLFKTKLVEQHPVLFVMYIGFIHS
jgi:hypothetical protein